MLTGNCLRLRIAVVMMMAVIAPACTLMAVDPTPTVVPPTTIATSQPMLSFSPPPTITPDRPGTLVVPTPLPPASQPQDVVQSAGAALRRIRESGVVRVGVLFNNPPLSSFGERGEVVGYEPDLARQVAVLWGVEVQFVQVTRQNAAAMLQAGEVDLLMASLFHRREYEHDLSFSGSYFSNDQVLVVSSQSAVQTAVQLNGQAVGVVSGTDGEHVLSQAVDAGRLSPTLVRLLTVDQAIGALGSGEVGAIVLSRAIVPRILSLLPEARVLVDVLEPGPLAAAFRSHDESLRYFFDRAVQRLESDGTLVSLQHQWLSDQAGRFQVPVWGGLDEDPRQFATFDDSALAQGAPVFDRLQNGLPIRVAGLDQGSAADSFQDRLMVFYQLLVDEMASRWGAQMTVVADSAVSALDLLASGQADLVVGVTPRWDGPYEVAYTAPVVARGNRLMRQVGSPIEGFADLRGGRWVGVLASQPGTADEVNALAAQVNVVVNIFTIINDEDAAYAMLVNQNADVVYGDSLRLQPVLEANAGQVELTGRWYTRTYETLAMPRQDLAFRTLVAITLQDIAADGTFESLWRATTAAGEPYPLEQWPGQFDPLADPSG